MIECPYCQHKNKMCLQICVPGIIYTDECSNCHKNFGLSVKCNTKKLPCANGELHKWVKYNVRAIQDISEQLSHEYVKCEYCNDIEAIIRNNREQSR